MSIQISSLITANCHTRFFLPPCNDGVGFQSQDLSFAAQQQQQESLISTVVKEYIVMVVLFSTTTSWYVSSSNQLAARLSVRPFFRTTTENQTLILYCSLYASRRTNKQTDKTVVQVRFNSRRGSCNFKQKTEEEKRLFDCLTGQTHLCFRANQQNERRRAEQ